MDGGLGRVIGETCRGTVYCNGTSHIVVHSDGSWETVDKDLICDHTGDRTIRYLVADDDRLGDLTIASETRMRTMLRSCWHEWREANPALTFASIMAQTEPLGDWMKRNGERRESALDAAVDVRTRRAVERAALAPPAAEQVHEPPRGCGKGSQ